MRRTIIISMAIGAVACNRDSGVPDDWEPPEKDTRQAGDSTPDTTAHAQDTSGSRCTRLSLSGVGLVFLDGSSSDTNFAIVWTTAGGNFVSGQNTLTPTVDSAGTYTLLITNTLTGCTSSATVAVTSNMQAPPAPAGNPAPTAR